MCLFLQYKSRMCYRIYIRICSCITHIVLCKTSPYAYLNLYFITLYMTAISWYSPLPIRW
jgi:hypothetical protein